jgi:hypothetical protein
LVDREWKPNAYNIAPIERPDMSNLVETVWSQPCAMPA